MPKKTKVLATNSFEGQLVGESKAIQDIRRLILQMSEVDIPVLISGESGVGKELVARLIHYHGNRANYPFVTINIGAIPNQLAVAELFGFTKGAFTNAYKDRGGRLEIANKGSMVIDGLENAPPEVQRGLTRFLDTSKVYRIGDPEGKKINVRLIATTIYQYIDLVRSGKVIVDLVSRFANNVVYIPPLRDRKQDIPVLVEQFLTKIRNEQGIALASELSSNAMQALQAYDYPGNVRELYSMLERAAVIAQGDIITRDDLGRLDEVLKADDSAVLRSELESTRKELDHLQHTTISADPIWEGRSFPTEDDYCFVLMPFAEFKDMQKVYQNHIKTVLEKQCGLRCERADDTYDISGVMQSVWEGINRARLIIADYGGR